MGGYDTEGAGGAGLFNSTYDDGFTHGFGSVDEGVQSAGARTGNHFNPWGMAGGTESTQLDTRRRRKPAYYSS